MADRQLPAEFWEMLQDGRVDDFYTHAVGFVLTREQYAGLLNINFIYSKIINLNT